MKIKEYKLYKTAKKTAKENELIVKSDDTKVLYDFSLYYEYFKNIISEENLKGIIENVIKYHYFLNDWEYSFYTSKLGARYASNTHFIYHKVYDKKTWKRSYIVLQVDKIELSIIDGYGNITDTFNVSSDYSTPPDDIVLGA